MRFSICVCTYNRAQILPHCLESLANLNVPVGCEAEILVIDNNSVDNTRDVVDEYSRRSQIPIFYFHELQQGISTARNRAVKEARGDYIGFLDDECVVRPDWLEIIVADIDEFSPFIIGGPYVGAVLPGTAPKWFKTEYGDAYFLAYKYERGYQKGFRASGGNMVLHRSVFEAQRFDQKYGPKGNELKFGEETFLQEHFLRQNVDTMVFYEPRIDVAHYILSHKLSLSYYARRQMEMGACHIKMRAAAIPFEVTRVLVELCVSSLRTAFRDRSAYPYWQNYAYERVIPRVMPVIGAALERFRGRYR